MDKRGVLVEDFWGLAKLVVAIGLVFFLILPNWNQLSGKTKSLINVVTVQDEDIQAFYDKYGMSGFAKLNTNEKLDLCRRTKEAIEKKSSQSVSLECYNMEGMLKILKESEVQCDPRDVGNMFFLTAKCYADDDHDYAAAVRILEELRGITNYRSFPIGSQADSLYLSSQRLRIEDLYRGLRCDEADALFDKLKGENLLKTDEILKFNTLKEDCRKAIGQTAKDKIDAYTTSHNTSVPAKDVQELYGFALRDFLLSQSSGRPDKKDSAIALFQQVEDVFGSDSSFARYVLASRYHRNHLQGGCQGYAENVKFLAGNPPLHSLTFPTEDTTENSGEKNENIYSESLYALWKCDSKALLGSLPAPAHLLLATFDEATNEKVSDVGTIFRDGCKNLNSQGIKTWFGVEYSDCFSVNQEYGTGLFRCFFTDDKAWPHIGSGGDTGTCHSCLELKGKGCSGYSLNYFPDSDDLVQACTTDLCRISVSGDGCKVEGTGTNLLCIDKSS